MLVKSPQAHYLIGSAVEARGKQSSRLAVIKLLVLLKAHDHFSLQYYRIRASHFG